MLKTTIASLYWLRLASVSKGKKLILLNINLNINKKLSAYLLLICCYSVSYQEIQNIKTFSYVCLNWTCGWMLLKQIGAIAKSVNWISYLILVKLLSGGFWLLPAFQKFGIWYVKHCVYHLLNIKIVRVHKHRAIRFSEMVSVCQSKWE